MNPSPASPVTVTVPVPALIFEAYSISTLSSSVTTIFFPALVTVRDVTSGFIAAPVYVYFPEPSAITALLISRALMLNVVDTEPLYAFIPFAITVAVPSSILFTYTSA